MTLNLGFVSNFITQWTVSYSLIAIVYFQMIVEMARRCKCLVTHVTYIIARIKMRPLMTDKSAHVCIAIRTENAAKDIIVVYLFMLMQFPIVRKSGLATGPGARVIIAIVYFVWRVESGDVTFEACL